MFNELGLPLRGGPDLEFKAQNNKATNQIILISSVKKNKTTKSPPEGG